MIMKPLTVPAGTRVFLGAPAKPMPTAKAKVIGALADSIEGIAEAHLPQCFVSGIMANPAQVLVLVIEPGVDSDDVLNRVSHGLEAILSEAGEIDVWPISFQSPLLADVRRANCNIGKARSRTPMFAKPWWKFWS